MGGFDLVETDQFQNLSMRNTGGLLLGYDILDREHHNLTIGAGPAGVYQDFTTDPATVTPSASGILRYEFMFRGDDVIVFHKSQVFKDLGHGSATRVNADQGIRVKVYNNWRVNFEYDFRYNSLPVSGQTDGRHQYYLWIQLRHSTLTRRPSSDSRWQPDCGG